MMASSIIGSRIPQLTVNWNQWTKPGQTTSSRVQSKAACIVCNADR